MSYVRCIRCYDEDAIGGGEAGGVLPFAIWFFLGGKPKERARRRGLNRSEDSGGDVLPNVLPLPRKSSQKQDEPRAITMGYVIEIEGTAGNQTKHKSNS